MKNQSIPASDPDQLVIEPVDGSRLYLGNAQVVHKFVGDFADDVMRAYGGYLTGQADAAASMAHIEALIREYGEAFMGNDQRYEIAPWQGKRMAGKLLAALPAMKGDDDPGDALFRCIALQCVKASMALADGKSDAYVGAQLKEILDDARGRILGVIL